MNLMRLSIYNPTGTPGSRPRPRLQSRACRAWVPGGDEPTAGRGRRSPPLGSQPGPPRSAWFLRSKSLLSSAESLVLNGERRPSENQRRRVAVQLVDSWGKTRRAAAAAACWHSGCWLRITWQRDAGNFLGSQRLHLENTVTNYGYFFLQFSNLQNLQGNQKFHL